MNIILIIALVVIVYIIFCFVIAIIRALFSKREKRKHNFTKIFRSFFFEIINPFNWFDIF